MCWRSRSEGQVRWKRRLSSKEWELWPCCVSFSTYNCSLRDFTTASPRGAWSPAGAAVNVLPTCEQIPPETNRLWADWISFCRLIYIPSSSVPPKVNRATVLSQRHGRHGSRSVQIKHLGYIPAEALYPDLKHISTSFYPVTKTLDVLCVIVRRKLSWGDTETFPTCFSVPNCNRLHNVESFFHHRRFLWWKLTAEDIIVGFLALDFPFFRKLESSKSWLYFWKEDYFYGADFFFQREVRKGRNTEWGFENALPHQGSGSSKFWELWWRVKMFFSKCKK